VNRWPGFHLSTIESGKRNNNQPPGKDLLLDKERKLRRIVERIGKTAVAFSGGADSSLLLKIALDVLGSDNILVLTFRSHLFKSSELDRAATWLDRHGRTEFVRHEFFDADPLTWDDFVANPEDRCYLCKDRVYRMFMEMAGMKGFDRLVDGTNFDDMNSFRPGLRALKELEIGTPLADAALNKEEVRLLSRKLGLDTWEHPSSSCLATRIPSGLEITMDRLQLVSLCESGLEKLDFQGCRFRLDRYDETTGYVQVLKKDLIRMGTLKIFESLNQIFSDFGIKNIFFDLEGR